MLVAEVAMVLAASLGRARQRGIRLLASPPRGRLVLLVGCWLSRSADRGDHGCRGGAPLMMLVLPLVVASLVLAHGTLPWFIVSCCPAPARSRPREPDYHPAVAVDDHPRPGVHRPARVVRRSRLGVAGVEGESMLVDLRDRILMLGRLPELLSCWTWPRRAPVRRRDGRSPATSWWPPLRERLEVVVVDVSGKGEAAGTRALLLSGAFGGLLGAIPPAGVPAGGERLPARQGWDEGFATAVHVSLDLATGDYVLGARRAPAGRHVRRLRPLGRALRARARCSR